jgi:hypothetical protein
VQTVRNQAGRVGGDTQTEHRAGHGARCDPFTFRMGLHTGCGNKR